MYENRTMLYTQTMVSALPEGTSLNLTAEQNATLFAIGQVNVTTLINNVTSKSAATSLSSPSSVVLCHYFTFKHSSTFGILSGFFKS